MRLEIKSCNLSNNLEIQFSVGIRPTLRDFMIMSIPEIASLVYDLATTTTTSDMSPARREVVFHEMLQMSLWYVVVCPSGESRS